MTVWLILSVLAAAVIAGLAVPLFRARRVPAPDRAEYDKAVFRDQLAELDRDLARGAIGETEAAAARNEIARRLIAVSQTAPAAAVASASGRWLALAAAILVPIIALPVYLQVGSPNLPDVPRAARLENAIAAGDFVALVAKVEAHLAQNPGDLEGWKVLAPAYKREQRWEDAANAYATIMRLAPDDIEAAADYGEMLVFANAGMVPAEAERVFADILKRNKAVPKARFYSALALKQEGRLDEARAAFEAFLADSAADAPWRPMLEAELKDMESRVPGLTADQMAAGANMSATEREAMIRTMVDGLETKLKADGSDLAGWQKLIRARVVLNEADKAKAALETARGLFKDQPQAQEALDGLAKELNLI